jgi:dynein heavy chain, axonemal
MVEKVDEILRELKNNVEGTKQVLKQWEETLLFERRPERTFTFQELRDEFDRSISARHSAMSDNGKAIGKNVSSSYRTLVVRPEPSDWKAYTDYVSNIVIDGFGVGIMTSVQYLTKQLQACNIPESDVAPLLEVQMLLKDGRIQWKPDLGLGDEDDIGVLRMFSQWSKRYMSTGDLMKRLDVGEGTYTIEIEEDYDVLNSIGQLQQVPYCLGAKAVRCIAIRVVGFQEIGVSASMPVKCSITPENC